MIKNNTRAHAPASTARTPQAPPTPRPDQELEGLVRGLADNLGALHGLLAQLVELADRKLAAMRSADAADLAAAAGCEEALLGEIFRVDQQREATLARLAQLLPAAPRRRTALAEIAACLPEPLASLLRARGTGLQDIAARLRERNALAARVARGLQSHIRAIFNDLARSNRESVVYGPHGQHESNTARSWLDAVG